MYQIDFTDIVEQAWLAYDASRTIKSVSDISAKVSTNHVYKVVFTNDSFVIAKLSYFGRYEHFVEDHSIINVLANNLPAPFENFLARSLIKENELFVHRVKNDQVDAWVVFYRPVRIHKTLPRRLETKHIKALGKEFATFHQACSQVKNTLPKSSKTLYSDLEHLLEILNSDFGKYEHRGYVDTIKAQIDTFFENTQQLGLSEVEKIPVFVDWNIGNFSIGTGTSLYSRWDYDWFRISTRVMDFYFLSRIVSDIGDRTVFSYNIGPLNEDRFILFLKAYHKHNPLTEAEIRLLKEAYRFFILNYVIKDGRYFFHEIYATKLQQEAYTLYFPNLEAGFDADKLLKALKL
jgi:Ser/Thr protein kinase RdoA (MazF antagonist)